MAPQAVPTINGTAGSNPPNGTAIVVGSTVQLNNTNGGGEVSYLWELLDIPEGSASALSDPAIQNPTFVADSEGTYLVKLTVNRTLSNEASTKVIVGVSQLKTLMRIPAAGESTEMSTLRGWAMSMNRNLRLVDNLRSDPGYMTGYAAGTEAAGHVLYISGLQTLKSGLPGEEKVPIFTSAVATSATSTDLPLWVFVSKAGGGTSVSSGDLLYARLSGVAGPFTLSGGSAGDAVYLSDTGQVSDTPGTYVRRLGTIVLVGGADRELRLHRRPSPDVRCRGGHHPLAARRLGLPDARARRHHRRRVCRANGSRSDAQPRTPAVDGGPPGFD